MSLSSYRSAIERLTRDKANLEQEVARERDKMARLQHDISSIARSITSSTSLSTLQSKQKQMQSKEQEVARVQKKLADLQAKIASKISEIHRQVTNLERAEEQERRRQDTESRRRRDEELRHVRTVTRETERQARLYSELGSSRLVIDVARLPESITVLFVASNPLDQSQLRLDEEIRAITQKIRASEHRDSVNLKACWAARPGDLLQALNEHRPHVVHFSGHGSDADELVFQSDDGTTKLVPKDAIVATMKIVSDNIRLVIFNACFSSAQAEAVTEHVDAAIGMNAPISDDAARIFAAQFYSAIGFGRSIEEAFNQGRVALMLEGVSEEDTPNLFFHDGIDPREVVLVRPPSLDMD